MLKIKAVIEGSEQFQPAGGSESDPPDTGAAAQCFKDPFLISYLTVNHTKELLYEQLLFNRKLDKNHML